MRSSRGIRGVRTLWEQERETGTNRGGVMYTFSTWEGGGGGIMVRWKGVIVVPQDSLLAAVSTSDV